MAWVEALEQIDEVGEAPTVLHRHGVTVRGDGAIATGRHLALRSRDGFVVEFETIVKEVR